MSTARIDTGEPPLANPVVCWFGPQFSRLDPLLQALHRNGGTLRGRVEIVLGPGIAGWLGKRFARVLGVPLGARSRRFEVSIAHDGASLVWTRCFDGHAVMRSVFHPVGEWPHGYWIERTGLVRMKLTVDVIDGGWYWRALGMSVGQVPLPLWLFPRSAAYKRIERGCYAFGVTLSLPLLGPTLGYRGLLDAAPATGARA